MTNPAPLPDRFEVQIGRWRRDRHPAEWAAAADTLAAMLMESRGPARAESIDAAIPLYEGVREVRTRKSAPLEWASATYNLANAYLHRVRGDRAANVERAVSLYEAALDVRTRDAAPEPWAATALNLASALRARPHGDPAENLERAIRLIEEVLEVWTRDTRPERWADAVNNLAVACRNRLRGDRTENLERALSLFDEALTVHTRETHPAQWAQAVRNRANVLLVRTRGDRAENLERAIEAYRDVLRARPRDEDPDAWAIAQNNLGIAFRHRVHGSRAKNLERALRAFARSLQVRSRRADPVAWARTLSNLGNAYQKRVRGDRGDNLERAIRAYRGALTVQRRDRHPAEWAQTAHNLAVALTDRVHGAARTNLERSIRLHREALEVRRRDVFPLDWAESMDNLARAYERRHSGDRGHDVSMAARGYQAALEVYDAAVFPADCRRVARRLGRLLAREARWDAAAAAYTRAVEAAEASYRETLLPGGRDAHLARVSGLYPAAAYACLRAGRAGDAVVFLERGRARAVGDALERDRADLHRMAGTHPELASRYAETVRALRDVEREARAGDARARSPLLRDRAETMRTRLSETIARIQALPGLARFLESPGLEHVFAAVRPGAPFAYLVAAEPGSAALLVHAEAGAPRVEPLRADGFTLRDVRALGAAPLVHAAGGAAARHLAPTPRPPAGGGSPHGLLPGQHDGSAQLGRALEEALPRLGEGLMAPLVARLRELGSASVTLIPTDALALLPLHAARFPSLTGAPYLLDEFDVAFAPSARMLAQARAVEEAVEGRPPVLAGVGNPLSHSRSLPFARVEVEAITRRFPPGAARALCGREATKEAVLKILSGATYLHFACHGVFDPASPLDSGLELADGARLTLRELLAEARGVEARLVGLSACQSGVSEFRAAPDEGLGLPLAFLQAGAAGVVATLWPVDDLRTALLMTRFYELLLPSGDAEPQSPARALREAQAWLRGLSREAAAAHLGECDAEGARRVRARSEPVDGPADAAGFAGPADWAAFVYVGA
jgi:CHAT domain-containing protein/tetratricopeptide (TPR) repeat protein